MVFGQGWGQQMFAGVQRAVPEGLTYQKDGSSASGEVA